MDMTGTFRKESRGIEGSGLGSVGILCLSISPCIHVLMCDN